MAGAFPKLNFVLNTTCFFFASQKLNYSTTFFLFQHFSSIVELHPLQTRSYLHRSSSPILNITNTWTPKMCPLLMKMMMFGYHLGYQLKTLTVKQQKAKQKKVTAAANLAGSKKPVTLTRLPLPMPLQCSQLRIIKQNQRRVLPHCPTTKAGSLPSSSSQWWYCSSARWSSSGRRTPETRRRRRRRSSFTISPPKAVTSVKGHHPIRSRMSSLKSSQLQMDRGKSVNQQSEQYQQQK